MGKEYLASGDITLCDAAVGSLGEELPGGVEERDDVDWTGLWGKVPHFRTLFFLLKGTLLKRNQRGTSLRTEKDPHFGNIGPCYRELSHSWD